MMWRVYFYNRSGLPEVECSGLLTRQAFPLELMMGFSTFREQNTTQSFANDLIIDWING